MPSEPLHAPMGSSEMRPANDYFFQRRGTSAKERAQSREANERRAAVARAAMAPSDTSPVPPGTLKGLQDEWRAYCASAGKNERSERATTARLGRVRIEARGSLSSLRRGDIVLVWHDHPAARNPICTTWHPRNAILTVVSTETVDLVEESKPAKLARRARRRK